MQDKGLIARAIEPFQRLVCLFLGHRGGPWSYYKRGLDGEIYEAAGARDGQWGLQYCLRCGAARRWVRPLSRHARLRLRAAVMDAGRRERRQM